MAIFSLNRCGMSRLKTYVLVDLKVDETNVAIENSTIKLLNNSKNMDTTKELKPMNKLQQESQILKAGEQTS